MRQAQRFIVWVSEQGHAWEPNGDGPMTRKEAERIAREIRQDTGARAFCAAEGYDPNRATSDATEPEAA